MKKSFETRFRTVLMAAVFAAYTIIAGGSAESMAFSFLIIVVIVVVAIVVAICKSIHESNMNSVARWNKHVLESKEKEFDMSDCTSNNQCALYYDNKKKEVMVVVLASDEPKKEVFKNFHKDASATMSGYVCAADTARGTILVVKTEWGEMTTTLVDYAKRDGEAAPTSTIAPVMTGNSDGSDASSVFVLVDEARGETVTVHAADNKVQVYQYISRELAVMKTTGCAAVRAIGKYVFVADDAVHVFIIINGKGEGTQLRYEDILKVSYEEDGRTIFSRSAGRTIGGAVAGGVLFGGAGAVVGGLSGKSTGEKKVKTMEVRIVTRNAASPAIILSLHCGSYDELNVNESKYKELKKIALDIRDLISVIIDKAQTPPELPRPEVSESVDKVVGDDKSATTGSTSIADELLKLAKLKDAGIITDEEFNELKKKLIGS